MSSGSAPGQDVRIKMRAGKGVSNPEMSSGKAPRQDVRIKMGAGRGASNPGMSSGKVPRQDVRIKMGAGKGASNPGMSSGNVPRQDVRIKMGAGNPCCPHPVWGFKNIKAGGGGVRGRGAPASLHVALSIVFETCFQTVCFPSTHVHWH